MTRATRHFCNAMIREAKGYDPEPMPTPGEKIICCHNNKNLGLLNGSMWRVIRCKRAGEYFRAEIEPWEVALRCEEAKLNVFMHREPFNAGEPVAEDKRDAEQFTWGYCITVHKAQGSQWPHVAVINDSWPGPDRFQDRWMYTAITRAQERVTIIKPQAAARRLVASPARRPARAAARAPLTGFPARPKGLANRR
jgi:exodeoxyribonuclease-5